MFRIAEIVTSQGHWITWQGLYETKASAQSEIDRVRARGATGKLAIVPLSWGA